MSSQRLRCLASCKCGNTPPSQGGAAAASGNLRSPAFQCGGTWWTAFRHGLFLLFLFFRFRDARTFRQSARTFRAVLAHPRRATGQFAPIPPRLDAATNQPTLTIVIPAFNEQTRIGPTLRSYLWYLSQSDRWTNTSILVVDDGSTDATADTVRCIAAASGGGCGISCLSLPVNEGKGAALAAAVELVDSESIILTTDADGSADVASLEVLYDAMLSSNDDSTLNEMPVVCGYRTYGDTAAGRLIFRWGFRTTVMIFCGDLGTRDSQCGFKLMAASTAKRLYKNLHLPGWSHDVEVLYRAKLLGVPVTEAPVRWQDKDGSKLKAEGILKVSSRMFYDVLLCRFSYAAGWWRVDGCGPN